MRSVWQRGDGGLHHLAGVVGVLVQHGDDLFDGDGVVAFAPAIVVGHHGDGGVTDFGFAGELGFLQVGHADHVGAPAAIEVRLGLGGELRAFHADVGAAEFADDADRAAGMRRGFGDSGADRIAEGHVAHDAVAEERGDAMEGAIDELVGNDEVGGLVLFLERADGGDGKDALDAEFLEGVDVGAEVEFRGQNAMAAAVAREEGDFAAFQFAENEGVGWIAERRFHAHFVLIGEAGHGIEPAAADDADFRLSQDLLLTRTRRRFAQPRGRLCRKHLSIKVGCDGDSMRKGGNGMRRMLRQTGGRCARTGRPARARRGLEMEKAIGAVDEAEGDEGDKDFADGANREGPPALLAQLAKTGAQTDTCKREQEGPAREIGDGSELRFGEEAKRGQQRDQQKSQHKLREFAPQELRLVADGLGLAARRPVDGVSEDDEADECVAGGLGQHGDLAGGVGVERSGSSGFRGVVDGEARPEAVGLVAEME